MIEQTLKQLDFTDKEIDVYIVILRRGKVLPADIAQLTRINRSTVYSVIKELIKKGVVAEDLGGATKYIVALPLEELHSYVANEEKKLEQKKQLIPTAINELMQISKDRANVIPKITFVSEEDVEKHLFLRSDEWNRSIKERNVLWWGFQDKHFVTHYESWIDDFWIKRTSAEGVQLRLLSDHAAEKIKGRKYERRQIKFWNKTNDFTATTWVVGDYIVMIVANQRPRYLVEIYDAALAHNFREVFKGLWEEVD